MKKWLISSMLKSKKFWYAVASIVVPVIVTYLGVDEETVKVLDPTNDGRVSQEDARIITDAVIKDDNMVKDQLTRYYTNFLKQNHNLGTKNRPITPEEDPNEFA